MFQELLKISKRIAALNINQLLRECWEDTMVQDFIIEELNQGNQLRFGKKSTGEDVGEYRSDSYARLKKSLGSKAPFGVVDLLAEGDFYRTFKVIPNNSGFEITADTSLYPPTDFSVKYGEDILGLSADSIEKLQTFILPILKDKIERRVFR